MARLEERQDEAMSQRAPGILLGMGAIVMLGHFSDMTIATGADHVTPSMDEHTPEPLPLP